MPRTDIFFEVNTADGRKIRLTKKQWSHISSKHTELTNKLHLLEQALLYSSYKTQFSSETIKYYLYLKELKCYLMVAVKILNGDGFIMTAYYTRK